MLEIFYQGFEIFLCIFLALNLIMELNYMGFGSDNSMYIERRFRIFL